RGRLLQLDGRKPIRRGGGGSRRCRGVGRVPGRWRWGEGQSQLDHRVGRCVRGGGGGGRAGVRAGGLVGAAGGGGGRDARGGRRGAGGRRPGNREAGIPGGGGGGGGTSGTAGSRGGSEGGSGIVITRSPRFCFNPSPPTSAALGGPTLSGGAPAYVPPSLPV